MTTILRTFADVEEIMKQWVFMAKYFSKKNVR
jgi:hypothetical protein